MLEIELFCTMFTGIIETVGRIEAMAPSGSNVDFTISSSISHDLRADQSVAHNGVCLTVTEASNGIHRVTAIQETLSKTALSKLAVGGLVNLERCMLANGRFDGHIVQGHVDQVGEVVSIADRSGSWVIDFRYDPATENITVEKGSICIDGISLTCFNSRDGAFSVAIIPYTLEHTNFKYLREGDRVNLEFDVIGKYVQRLLGRR